MRFDERTMLKLLAALGARPETSSEFRADYPLAAWPDTPEGRTEQERAVRRARRARLRARHRRGHGR